MARKLIYIEKLKAAREVLHDLLEDGEDGDIEQLNAAREAEQKAVEGLREHAEEFIELKDRIAIIDRAIKKKEEELEKLKAERDELVRTKAIVLGVSVKKREKT